MNNKKIICFQLLNDYSGSPKVLKTVLDGLCRNDIPVDLYTSETQGVLNELKGRENFQMHTYRYNFSDNPLVTLFRFTWIQVLTFFWAFKYAFCSNVVFYINTLLPIGPALAGRIMGKRVIYHYHENADVKGVFYRFLAAGMQRLAHEIICVSKYQSLFLRRQDKVTVIPNAIPAKLVEKLSPDVAAGYARQTVLMLGSLREYKGTVEFYRLAHALPAYRFVFVVNDTQTNIDLFVREKGLVQPDNLMVYDRQKDVSKFYNESSLVLNLSNKNLFIETFGLTALEAMSAALPIIVPTVGGIAEMVDDGVNGYKIDVQDLDQIEAKITEILSDKDLYEHLSQNALKKSRQYDEETMINKIEKIIKK